MIKFFSFIWYVYYIYLVIKVVGDLDRLCFLRGDLDRDLDLDFIVFIDFLASLETERDLAGEADLDRDLDRPRLAITTDFWEDWVAPILIKIKNILLIFEKLSFIYFNL